MRNPLPEIDRQPLAREAQCAVSRRTEHGELAPVRVIGVGSPLGDDRLGWVVVERLRESLRAEHRRAISLLACDRPGAALLNLLRGARRVIVVDAVYAEGPPGEVVRIAHVDPLATHCGVSGHGFGLAHALALGRALNCLPATLNVFGISIDPQGLTEPRDGGGLSDVVERAVDDLCRRILDELESPHAVYS